MKQPTTILPSHEEKASYVNRLFASIASRYDLMNRLMTAGQDRHWRAELVSQAELPPRGCLLDVGTGTGDIAYEALRQYPASQVVGCDFTYEMMSAGQRKRPMSPLALSFIQADALAMPFPDDIFDAVTSGFVLRNVVDIDAALGEQVRVTKPGGRVVCLETTPPSAALLSPAFRFYFFRVVPALGALVSGQAAAYRYLPHSTLQFPTPEELARKMERVGLRNVFYVTRMLGTVAIHVGMA